MSRSNMTPSDHELERAIAILDTVYVEPTLSLDRVVLMLSEELARRRRARKLLAIMERVGDHCTIGMARAMLEAEELHHVPS